MFKPKIETTVAILEQRINCVKLGGKNCIDRRCQDCEYHYDADKLERSLAHAVEYIKKTIGEKI